MADEKVNMGPEENKTPETQSPPGQGDLPPLEENNAPAVSGEDKAAPDHVEPDPPSADNHTQQTVLPGMGEDTPAPSGKVINLSDIQAADKDGKEASTTAPEKKAPEADQPKKRRGRPPKEQAAVSAGKKEKAAEPRTGRPSKVDKAAREEAPPAVRDKVSRGNKSDKGKETGSGGAPVTKSAKAVKPGKAAPVKEAAVPPPEINLPPPPGEVTPEEANKIGYETAMRWTKGKYQFFVCTHIDKGHIHNHIYYNSTAQDCSRKFHNFIGSSFAVRRLSDRVCIEHELSVIQNPKQHSKGCFLHYGQWIGEKPPSAQQRVRLGIVAALEQKPADFPAFLRLMEESSFQVKHGRGGAISFLAPGQEKYTRLRASTLGPGFDPDDIRAAIAGELRDTEAALSKTS